MKGRRLIYREKFFEFTVETEYGGTVTNVKKKRVPGGWSSYSKTTRTEACTYYSAAYISQTLDQQLLHNVGSATCLA